MARARNIKPALFSNDELAEIPPLGRLLFIGLWTIADYKGCIIWREKRVKAQLLPYDNCDIKKLMINLDKSGFIRYYSDGEKIYLKVVNFSTHQNPHKNEKEKGSDIPDYSDNMRQLIDLKVLSIKSDKIAINPDKNGIAPADSLLLIPDSVNHITEPPSTVVDDEFDLFWGKYKKKADRIGAKKSFTRLSAAKKEMATNDCYLRYVDTDKQYVPNATTYLNGERWNDEIIEAKNNDKRIDTRNQATRTFDAIRNLPDN